MTKRVIVGLAVVLAAALIPTTATAIGPTDAGGIDIAGAELAGSLGVAAVNVFGTVRCASAGPLNLDVELVQQSTGGVGFGENNGLACPAPGDLVKWAVTAGGVGFVVGDKVTITAAALGATNATDVEDHVLRWGR
jgi:hypothetical protein